MVKSTVLSRAMASFRLAARRRRVVLGHSKPRFMSLPTMLLPRCVSFDTVMCEIA
jgi:hypothetical protein